MTSQKIEIPVNLCGFCDLTNQPIMIGDEYIGVTKDTMIGPSFHLRFKKVPMDNCEQFVKYLYKDRKFELETRVATTQDHEELILSLHNKNDERIITKWGHLLNGQISHDIPMIISMLKKKEDNMDFLKDMVSINCLYSRLLE